MDGSSQAPSGELPCKQNRATRKGTPCLAQRESSVFQETFHFLGLKFYTKVAQDYFFFFSLCLCLSSLVRNKCEMAEPLSSLAPLLPYVNDVQKYKNHQISPFKLKSCSKTFSHSELFFFLLLPFLTFVTRHQYPRFCVICQCTIYFDKNIQTTSFDYFKTKPLFCCPPVTTPKNPVWYRLSLIWALVCFGKILLALAGLGTSFIHGKQE